MSQPGQELSVTGRFLKRCKTYDFQNHLFFTIKCLEIFWFYYFYRNLPQVTYIFGFLLRTAGLNPADAPYIIMLLLYDKQSVL